ncbi:MAG: AraC family transcriptional regulator [Burkholderiales bacterium]|nr:AraC family transcriptional regulator [Burkholderiales bacterium]
MLQARLDLAASLTDPFFSEVLFDALPDVVFFVKDKQGRYVLVNQTMVERCGFTKKTHLQGKAVDDLFAPRFALHYRQQDLDVLTDGRSIHDQLELHLYPNHAPGWCLTTKIALRAQDGSIIGLAGISRDLHAPEATSPAYQKICKLVEYIHQHYQEDVRVPELARLAQMSVSQIERYFLKVYQISPRQMLQQARLNAACQMLASSQSITDVAAACGYQDHSAFARQFKATLGMTPSQYRLLLQEAPGQHGLRIARLR